MKFINLTPHTITEVESGKSFVSEGIARVSSNSYPMVKIGGITIYHTTFGEVIGMPMPAQDTTYIVSGMVLEALKGKRKDVVAPGELVRDDKGNPIGCKGFRY